MKNMVAELKVSIQGFVGNSYLGRDTLKLYTNSFV
jgi:hypothetical protein